MKPQGTFDGVELLGELMAAAVAWDPRNRSRTACVGRGETDQTEQP